MNFDIWINQTNDINWIILLPIFCPALVDLDEVTEVKTVVHGIIMGMEMPFPLPNPDACKDSGLSCPLMKGQNYEYVASLPIRRAYPKVSANEGDDNSLTTRFLIVLFDYHSV